MFSEKIRKVIAVIAIVSIGISSQGVMTFSASISGIVDNIVKKNSENEKDLKSYYYLSMTKRTMTYIDDDMGELSEDDIIEIDSNDVKSKDSTEDSFSEKNSDNFTPNHIENFDEDDETNGDTEYEDEPEEDEAKEAQVASLSEINEIEDISVSSKSDANDDSSNDNEDNNDNNDDNNDVEEESFEDKEEEIATESEAEDEMETTSEINNEDSIATDSEIEKEEDTATDSEAEKEGNIATDSEVEIATDSNLSVEVATKSDLTKATVSIVSDGSKWYVVDIFVATESTLNIKSDISVLDAIDKRVIKEADILITDGLGNYKTIKTPITWTSKIDEIRKNAKEKKEQENKELVKEKKIEKTVSARRLFTKALLEEESDKKNDEVVEVVEIDDNVIKNFKDNIPKEYIISYPSSVAKEEDEIEIKGRKRREWTKVVYDREEMLDMEYGVEEVEVEDEEFAPVKSNLAGLTMSNEEDKKYLYEEVENENIEGDDLVIEDEDISLKDKETNIIDDSGNIDINENDEEDTEETEEEVITKRSYVLDGEELIDENSNINIAYDKAYDYYGNYIGLLTRETTKLFDDNLNRIYSSDINLKNDTLYSKDGSYLSKTSSIDGDLVLPDEKEKMIYRDMLVDNAQRNTKQKNILKKQEETVIDKTLDAEEDIYVIDDTVLTKVLLLESVVLKNIKMPEIVVNYENAHKHKVCGVNGECEHTLFNHKEREEIEYKGGIVNSSGAYYLTKDTTYDGTLSGDLYICLNGYEFNFTGDDNGYNIYITDCGEGTSRVDLYGSTLTQKIYILGTSKNTIELVESDNANCDKYIFNVKCILKDEKDIEGYTNIDDIEEIELDDEIENVMTDVVKESTSFQDEIWENVVVEGTYSQENKHYIIKSASFKNNYNKNAEDVFRGSNITVASGDFYIVDCTSKDDLIQLGYPDGQANGNRTNFFRIEKNAHVSIMNTNLRGEVDQSSAIIEINPYSSLYVYGSLTISPSNVWKGEKVKNSKVYVKENGKIYIGDSYSVMSLNADESHAKNGSIYDIYMEKERSIIQEENGQLFESIFNVYLADLTGVFFENWDPTEPSNIVVLHKSYNGLGATIAVDMNNMTLSIVGSMKHFHKVCGIEGNCNHLRTDDHGDEIAYYLDGYNDSKTSGRHVLNKDTVISKDITLTGDLYLCLNGFNLTMTGRIIGNGNNKIVICDCKATGQITTTNYTYELFKNVNFEVYGSSADKPMTINGYRIYYTEKSTYVRAFNVKFIGKNEFGAGNSPVFVINNLNEKNTIFSNCTFNTFKAKSLIQVKGRIDFYGINNIKDNEFTNYVIYNESEKFVGLQGGATINIESNIIKSDIENTAILNFISGESGLIIDGTLNITNNTFATGKVTPKRQAAIYIPKGAYIYTIINKLKVLDNKSNNNIHAYQIYSERADGFMRSYTNETFIKQLNTDYSRFKVYINSPNGQGIVYKDWTAKTVQDVNKYNACVLLDEHYGDWATLELANNNINIKLAHAHKMCGITGDCKNHSGHNNDIGYSGLFDHNANGNWLLINNYVLKKDITLSGDLNLCLNGKTLDMGTYRFYGANEYKLTICDCKGTGKITTASNKVELFKNVKLELYGSSKEKPMTVEGYRIYYADKSTYIKAFNVKFVGKNEFGASNDPIFVLNTGNADTVFNNCEFTNFKAKSLIQATAQVNFEGISNIKNNEFTNYVMNYASGHTMKLGMVATLNIENNTIKSDIENTAIINFNNAGRLLIDIYAILNITNNTFATGTKTPKRQTAIYIPKEAYIDMKCILKVFDNKSNNKIHVYQIYSERTDGFMINNITYSEALKELFSPTYLDALPNEFNTSHTKFKVYINSPDGMGIVFKDWNDNTVQDVSKYSTCIIPDDKYNNTMDIVLSNNHVEIISRHRHKLCGATNECNGDHESHKTTVSYLGVDAISETNGNYFLTKNTTLTKNITLTGNMLLCLNGKTLDMGDYRFFGSADYLLVICDCVGDAKITTSKNKYELFKDIRINIYGRNISKPLTVEGYRIYYTESDNVMKASHTSFIGKNEFGAGNDPIFVFGAGKNLVVFSNCTFTMFKAKSLVKSKSQVIFYSADNKISNNEFTNYIIDIDANTAENNAVQNIGDEVEVKPSYSSNALMLAETAKISISSNTIKSDIENTAIINLHEGSGFYMSKQSVLNIDNNTFEAANISAMQSAVYVSKNSAITIGEQACIRVDNNKSTNITSVYQIFSDKTDGFINQGFNLDSTSRFKIFMNSTEGQIFVDSESSQKGLDYYRGIILPDNNYAGTLDLSNNNIVLKASHDVGHKRCGTAKDKKCSDHTGIGNHKEAYAFGIMPHEFPTQGGYFLMGNKTLDGNRTLTGDMALCLNGFTLDFQRFKITGNENYKLTICDCRGGGKIVGSGTLFGGINGKFELYGNSNSKMRIETQRIYVSDSQYTGENYIKAINIDFVYGNGEKINDSPILLFSNNNDSLFSNCTFRGFKSSRLMNVYTNLTFYGVNEIKNNEVSKAIINMSTNHNLVVKDDAVLNIEGNVVKADDTEVSIIKFDDVNVLSIEKNAALNVINNVFDEGTVTPKIQSAIYIPKNASIKLNSKMKVINNKSRNGFRAYQIYSNNGDGFITKDSKATIDTKNTRFAVYMTTGKTIFKGWGSSDEYYNCILLDDIYGTGCDLELSKSNVVIKVTHEDHSICGSTDKCDDRHKGEDHSKKITYDLYTDYQKKGNYFLINDTELNSDMTLEGDLYLCLNGYTLNMNAYRIVGNKYKLCICDCVGCGEIVAAENTRRYELFTNVNLEIYGHKYRPINVEGYRIYYTEENTYIKAFGINFLGKNDFGHKEDEIFHIYGNDSNSLFSNCSFSDFKGKALIDANVPIYFDLYNVINKNEFTRNVIFARAHCSLTLNENATLSIQRNTINPDTTKSIVICLEKDNLNIQKDALLNVVNNTFMAGKVKPQLQAALYVSEESYIQVNSMIKVQNNKSQNEAIVYQIYSRNANGFMTSQGNFNSNNSRVVVYVDTDDEKPMVFKDWGSNTVINIKNYVNCIKPDSVYQDGKVELLDKTIVITYAQHRHTLCGLEKCIDHSERLLYRSVEIRDITAYKKGRCYLNKNFALTSDIKLAGDLYLCLNGYTLEMAKYSFIGNEDYKLYICDCKGGGKIITSKNEKKCELFNNVEVELYGPSIDKKMTVEGYRIYSGRSIKDCIKASNVRFVGKNEFGDKGDPIFILNTGNADTEFRNCTFTNFKGKSLIQATAQVNFYGNCDIMNNEFTNYVMNYESGHTMVVTGGTLNIENNTIKSDIENTAIINFNNAGRLFIKAFSTLNITNNTFATGTKTPKRQAAIYIPKQTYIDMNYRLKVLDNKSNNKIHVYQIYSERADGFMTTNVTFDEFTRNYSIPYTHSRPDEFDTDGTRFKVYINSSDDVVPVFKNWTAYTVKDRGKYRDCIILDDKYDESKKAYLLNNNIVIGHMHKVCGDNICNHVGIADNTNLVKYSSNYDASKTSGRYVLTKDITLDKTINLTGDLYLCLNGHNLTVNGSINGNLKKLIICDCAKKGKVIAKNDTNYLFSDVKVELHNVTVESNLVYKSKANANIKASNVKFNGKSIVVKSISFDINKDAENSVFSNCTFNKIKSKTLIDAKGRIAFYGINNIYNNEVTNNIINMENTYDMTIGGSSELKIYTNTITTGIQYPVIVNAPDSGKILIEDRGKLIIEGNRFIKGTVAPVIPMGMYVPANGKIEIGHYAGFIVRGNGGDGMSCQVFSENENEENDNELLQVGYMCHVEIRLFINSNKTLQRIANGQVYSANLRDTVKPEWLYREAKVETKMPDHFTLNFRLKKWANKVKIGEHK